MDAEFAVEDALPQPDLWAAPARAAKAKTAPDKPHYLGHRERLRDRATDAGLAALPDYELLELILFRAIPRGDVKPLAKQLLARFGSLAGVLGASAEELTTGKGVGPTLALDLTLLHELSVRAAKAAVGKRPVISSWSALLAYVKTALAHE